MGSLESRIGRLEGRISWPQSEDEGAELGRAVLQDVMEEFGRLKGSRAHGYRGGSPIVPAYIPFKVLGPGYTTGQMMELAIRRVFERRGPSEAAPDVLSAAAVEDLISRWTGMFEEFSPRRRVDWNKVEDGP